MAIWDSKRPVPWRRLCTEWAFIGVVIAIVSATFFHERRLGSYLSIALGGVIYVAFGVVLAKFGYQRKTLKQMRVEAAMAPPKATSTASRTASTSARNRPAPTSRTSTGPSQRPKKKKR